MAQNCPDIFNNQLSQEVKGNVDFLLIFAFSLELKNDRVILRHSVFITVKRKQLL
jgi:hypothetical protein